MKKDSEDMKRRNCVPLIPALDPPDSLAGLARELKANGFENIIVVDDGSREERKQVFRELREKYGCDVLENARNMGQGRALKNGMDYYMSRFSGDYLGVIPFDCDGQHLVKDAVRLDAEVTKDDHSLVLGVRDFSRSDVPFKSRAGNRLTRNVLKFFIGGNVSDTQTGLRGIPNSLIREFLTVPAEHFEYNTAMLIESIRRGIPIREVAIETVYFDGNIATHFRAVKDSVLIYRLILSSFLKYASVSIASFVLDYGIFCFLAAVLAKAPDAERVWIATAAARVVSSLFNYLMNRSVVFNSKERVRETIFKYYGLCVIQLCCSAALVLLFSGISGLHPAAVKPFVDTVLFFISYHIQRRWVF